MIKPGTGHWALPLDKQNQHGMKSLPNTSTTTSNGNQTSDLLILSNTLYVWPHNIMSSLGFNELLFKVSYLTTVKNFMVHVF